MELSRRNMKGRKITRTKTGRQMSTQETTRDYRDTTRDKNIKNRIFQKEKR